MNSLAPLFSSLLLSSFIASSALAQVGIIVDPSTIPDLGSQRNGLVSVVLDYDEYSTIKTDKSWLRIDMLPAIEDRLAQLGYNPDLNNYIVRSVIVEAKSFAGKGQIRLCELQSPLLKDKSCSVINQFTLDG